MGYGEGRKYLHDDPRGRRPQQYRPDEVGDGVYDEPSPHAVEQEIHDRWLRARRQPPQGEEPEDPVR